MTNVKYNPTLSIPSQTLGPAGTTNSAAYPIYRSKLTGHLEVTAGATDALDLLSVSIEYSWDGVTFFAASPAHSFAAVIATAPPVRETIAFGAVKGTFFRLVYLIVGNPSDANESFTFQVDIMQHD